MNHVDTETWIETLIRARYPLLYVVSHEEGRVLSALYRVAANEHMRLLVWSATRGLRDWQNPDAPPTAPEETQDYLAILSYIEGLTEDALIALLDFHVYMEDPMVVRGLRDLVAILPDQRAVFKTVAILSPILTVPPTMEKELTVVDFPLPTAEDIDALLERVIATRSEQDIPVKLPPEDRNGLVQALQGLTLVEAENVLAQAVVITGEISSAAIPFILQEKQQIVRKSGALEFFPAHVTMADVGGLALLKEWVVERAEAFSQTAREFRLPAPRGVLLVGVPGGGKSLSVKAMAAEWQVPLLRLDMGSLFRGIVGGTEQAIRDALKLADALGRCVTWLDEVEKGLSGLGSSNVSDAGTTARTLATLLTWMEEHTSPVFVAATANVQTLDVLPPELIERFDDVFFVSEPTEEEREEIFTIHLRERGRDPADFDLKRLAQATEGMVGRQIKKLVYDALFRAFSAGETLTTEMVLDTLQAKSEGVKQFGQVSARPASTGARRPTVERGARPVRVMSRPDLVT